MSFADMNHLGSPQIPFFIIYELPGFLEEFPIAFSIFEFRVVLLLDWLPSKPRELSLSFYLINSWKEKKWIQVFPQGTVKTID